MRKSEIIELIDLHVKMLEPDFEQRTRELSNIYRNEYVKAIKDLKTAMESLQEPEMDPKVNFHGKFDFIKQIKDVKLRYDILKIRDTLFGKNPETLGIVLGDKASTYERANDEEYSLRKHAWVNIGKIAGMSLGFIFVYPLGCLILSSYLYENRHWFRKIPVVNKIIDYIDWFDKKYLGGLIESSTELLANFGGSPERFGKFFGSLCTIGMNIWNFIKEKQFPNSIPAKVATPDFEIVPLLGKSGRVRSLESELNKSKETEKLLSEKLADRDVELRNAVEESNLLRSELSEKANGLRKPEAPKVVTAETQTEFPMSPENNSRVPSVDAEIQTDPEASHAVMSRSNSRGAFPSGRGGVPLIGIDIGGS